MPKWKNFESIVSQYDLYIYPRPGIEAELIEIAKKIILTDAPVMEISSSFIREAIKNKREIRYYLPESVFEYLDEMNFYKR